MTYSIIKCYDNQGNRLWKSKRLEPFSHRLYIAINQAKYIIRAKEIWVKTVNEKAGTSKTEHIKFSPKKQNLPVLKRYTGADGIDTWLIPSRLSAYPLQ